MKKILFFPKYSEKGASSRYRIYSYIPFYERDNYDCSVKSLLDDWYLDAIWKKKSKLLLLPKLMMAYAKRIKDVLFVSKSQIVYIGAELLPFFPCVFERYLKLRKVKFIIEFDDAVFHNYDNNKHWLVRKLYGRKFF